MSDFPGRSFKWTEILSLMLENKMVRTERSMKEDLNQLRQYARKKYKSDLPIEERFKEYFDSGEEMFAILVKMFGDP